VVADYTGNADMPFDFFLSRYFEAYVTETEAFCKSLVEDSPVPCTGTDGLVALVMSLAADKSAAEGRWVKFSEIIEQVYCASPTECSLLANSEAFPEGFKPNANFQDLGKIISPDVDQKKKSSGSFMDKFKEMVGI
jgi:myo-inositol 2-dehydrogenase/D-chiro-inositol 1-dehydrogenase